jgi:hypothetical protein
MKVSHLVKIITNDLDNIELEVYRVKTTNEQIKKYKVIMVDEWRY